MNQPKCAEDDAIQKIEALIAKRDMVNTHIWRDQCIELLLELMIFVLRLLKERR